MVSVATGKQLVSHFLDLWILLVSVAQFGDSATRYFLINAVAVIFVGLTMMVNYFTLSYFVELEMAA